jgi:hypothetical protein
MELSASRASRETYFFSVAANQLQTMAEQLSLHINQQNIFALWNRDNQVLLPNGRGEFDGSTLSIYWGNKNQTYCKQNQEGPSGCLSKRITPQE